MKVDLFSIGRFTVHTYGVMIAIGVILCVLMGYYRAKRYEMKACQTICQAQYIFQ